MNVVEIDGRRARIDRPNDGWVSLFSKKGTVLLEKATTLPTTYIVVGKDGMLFCAVNLCENLSLLLHFSERALVSTESYLFTNRNK